MVQKDLMSVLMFIEESNMATALEEVGLLSSLFLWQLVFEMLDFS